MKISLKKFKGKRFTVYVYGYSFQMNILTRTNNHILPPGQRIETVENHDIDAVRSCDTTLNHK